jgi:ankyrin repeat protein
MRKIGLTPLLKKYRRALFITGGILLGVYLLLGLLNPLGGRRFGTRAQHIRSENQLKRLAMDLMLYAEDHAENFPATFSDLPYYHETDSPYAVGDRVRLFVPSNLEPSPILAEVFSHYSYIVTKDRCHLIVFERPSLWEDKLVSYIDLNLEGKWESNLNDSLLQNKVHRVPEQQFAEFISKLGSPVVDNSPAGSLVAAAENGEIETIRSLLSKGVQIDAKDRRGWTALTIATQTGRKDVVELLISKGAKINLRDNVGQCRTALMRASNLGYSDIVGVLLAHGADVRVKLDDGYTALMDALPYPSIVQKLIASGANVNEKSESEWSLLRGAAASGYAQTVRILIENGAILQKNGILTLESAAENGHADVIEVLLAHDIGANKQVLGESLRFAYSHPNALKKLISAGADLNSTIGHDRTTLMVSAINGCTDSVDLLIAAGADLNKKDSKGHTVLDLMLAVTKDEYELQRRPFRHKRCLGIIDTLRKNGAKESGLKIE